MSDVRVLSRDEVPILSLKDYASNEPARRERALRVLRESLDRLGFLVVSEHGVDMPLLDECYRVGTRFFDLPLEQKLALRYDKIDQKRYSNIGYFPFQTEVAIGSKVPDLKEFIHIGPSLQDGHPMRAYYGDNVWPASMPEFKAGFSRLFEQFNQCGAVLVDAIGETFGLERAYLKDLVDTGSSILRMLHYPPVPPGTTDAMRAAQHTGIQMLGLQPRTTHPGLQFYTPRNEWVVLPSGFEEHLAVNIGEMFAYLLNGQLKATLHRVVNAQGGSEQHHRYAIVHFFHANPLKSLRQMGAKSGQEMKAGDWLLKRLKELGLFQAD